MKIREVLELTQTIPLATIAKDRLTIGKVKATEALKASGCYCQNGVKGWFYDGDESILEKSIYDFVATSQQVASASELDAIDKLLLQNDSACDQ